MKHIASRSLRSRPRAVVLACSAAVLVFVSGCGTSGSEPSTSSSDEAISIPNSTASVPSSVVDAGDLSSGFALATWGDNVTVTIDAGSLHYVSDGLPNHERQAEYALPNAGVQVPDASNASAVVDPTVAQQYDFTIPLTPVKAATPTSTSLGTIGVMISGASLFNPYEGDGSTVATQSNFFVLDDAGDEVWFLDDCAGHPTPMGQYHYHALPKCVTVTIDQPDGPSHILGIAFDGFPIYGDRDINGRQIAAADLDQCNGITSVTPEFPDGVYHYVLLDVADSKSSIRCFSGSVDPTVGMGNMGGPPPQP